MGIKCIGERNMYLLLFGAIFYTQFTLASPPPPVPAHKVVSDSSKGVEDPSNLKKEVLELINLLQGKKFITREESIKRKQRSLVMGKSDLVKFKEDLLVELEQKQQTRGPASTSNPKDIREEHKKLENILPKVEQALRTLDPDTGESSEEEESIQ